MSDFSAKKRAVQTALRETLEPKQAAKLAHLLADQIFVDTSYDWLNDPKGFAEYVLAYQGMYYF